MKEIVRRTSLAEKKMQVEKDLEGGYGLGTWKDRDRAEEKMVAITLERMSLWFADAKLR